VGAARLTCGQAPDHMPNAQLKPKGEHLTSHGLVSSALTSASTYPTLSCL
jgi:hypothetical protein